MSTDTDPMDVEPDSAALGRGGEEGHREEGSRGAPTVGAPAPAPAAAAGAASAAVVPLPLPDASQHKLARDLTQGMNPINLATGIYGPRGERIRHVVHEGSLRLPVEALSLLVAHDEGSGATTSSSREAPLLPSSPRPSVVLPGLDSVVRPSLDLDLPTVVVTDVMSVVPPAPAFHDHNNAAALSVQPAAAVTVARNRVVTFAMAAAATTNKAPLGPLAVAAASQPPSEPERIRGGGDDEGGGEAPAPPAELDPKPAAEGGASAETPGADGAPMRDPSLVAGAVAQIPQAATTTSSTEPPADPLLPTLVPTPRPPAALPPSHPSAGSDAVPTPQPNTVPPPRSNVVPSAPQQPPPPPPPQQQQQQQLLQQQTHPLPSPQVATAAAGPSQPQPLVPSSGAGSAQVADPLRGPAPQAPTAPLSSFAVAAPASTTAASGPMQLQGPPPPSTVPAATAVPTAATAQGQPVSTATVNFGSVLASLAPASASTSSSAPVPPPAATANPIVQAAEPPPPAGAMSQPLVRSAFSPTKPSVAASAGVHPTPTPSVATSVPLPMASSSALPTQVPSAGTVPVAAPPSATAGPSRSAAPIPPTAPSSAAQAAPTTTSGPTASAQQQPPPPPQAATQPPPQPQVIPLKDKPNAQWEQHIPGPNEESQVDLASKTPKPDWYTSNGVSELERTVLYEWFDGSARHRTPESFVAAREKILEMSGKLGTRFITSTMVRRTLVGDVTSLTRLHDFLTTHALINEDSQNDSAPTPWCLQDDKNKRSTTWTDEMKEELLVAVVEQSRRAAKRPRLLDESRTASPPTGHGTTTAISIDWEEVSRRVGHGVSGKECEREFLALPIVPENDSISATATDRPITPDEHGPLSRAGDGKSGAPHGGGATAKSPHHDVLQEILDGCDPDLARAVTESALLLSGGSLKRAQAAGRVGLVLSRAVEVARSKEESVAHLLSELVDLRMKKLENRLAALDDIEGMLEAERVALELERRDLYTARCRHWFGGP